MQRETWSIGFVCTFGAAIGAFIALELAAQFSFGKYLWFIGPLVGGCVAYVIYDFKAVLRGIGQAWQSVHGWRPHFNRQKSKLGLMIVGYTFAVATGISFWFWSLIGMVFLNNPTTSNVASFAEMGTIVSLIMTAGLSMILLSDLDTDEVRKWKSFAVKMNIIMLPFWVTYHFIGLIGRPFHYIIRQIPSIVMFTIRFVKRVFFYVHSDVRVLCFMDAAFGAGVGYFAGSVIAGAIAGCLLGIINYEVVSKRILKLAPRR